MRGGRPRDEGDLVEAAAARAALADVDRIRENGDAVSYTFWAVGELVVAVRGSGDTWTGVAVPTARG